MARTPGISDVACVVNHCRAEAGQHCRAVDGSPMVGFWHTDRMAEAMLARRNQPNRRSEP